LNPEMELFMALIKRLWQSNRELAGHLAHVKTLKKLIPICMSCKRVRDDKGYWNDVETYISKRTGEHFTHGICPACLKISHPKHYKKLYGNTEPHN